MAWRVCDECDGVGTVEVETTERVEEPAPAGAVSYLGEIVDAPGFTQDQFERAMLRALKDDLRVSSYHDARYLVGCPGAYFYTASREHCDCKAGRAGVPCKHRAALIAHLDIREPHVRGEWAQLDQQRPIRKAVAA
jgi:hypothetical protein